MNCLYACLNAYSHVDSHDVETDHNFFLNVKLFMLIMDFIINKRVTFTLEIERF